MFKRSTTYYEKSEAPVTPYQKAAQVWDERIGSARVQAKNWRIAALASLALSSLLSGSLIWQSSRSIVTPYVVEIDARGTAQAIGPAYETYDPTDAQIAHQLAEFIRNVRSVSIDPIIVRQNWLKAYDYATDRAAAVLNNYARDHDPFAEVGQKTVAVEIVSVVRSSDASFEVRWREQTYRYGQLEGSEDYTAIISIVINQPRDAETLHKNPLGLYVHGINWSKDLISGGKL